MKAPLPIVLLHGAGETGASWDAWVPRLAPHRVIAPSLPGRAGIEGPAPASVAEAAAYVADVATRGEERFVVCGYSYGGAIALELALTRPDRVAALALVSTGARLRVHPAIFRALEAGNDPLRPGEPWSKADVPVASAMADWIAANAFDRLGQPLDVRAPTLVVSGDADMLTPSRNAKYLIEHIAGAELFVVPGGMHTVPHDEPDVVAAAVKGLAARASV